MQHLDRLLQGLQFQFVALGLIRKGVGEGHPEVELLFRKQAELVQVMGAAELKGQGAERLLLAKAQRHQIVEMLPRLLRGHGLAVLSRGGVHPISLKNRTRRRILAGAVGFVKLPEGP